MTPAELVAWAILLSLAVYAITGGADFGGGVWDLLAFGPRAKAQRDLVARSIAPIWEADHVWMIVVVVLLFTCFPRPFAALATYLHLPLLLALLGIVMRGAAFVFRGHRGASSRWSAVFSVSSLLTPVFLGVVVGSLAGGRLPASGAAGGFAELYVRPWLAAFPAAMGLFALALFAYLAAVYLTLESRDLALREDFRARALACGLLVAALAGGTLALARREAPALFAGLVGRPGFLAVTLAAGAGALALLWARRYAAARACAAAQGALIVVGWGLAQEPYLIFPAFRLEDSAAPREVLLPVLSVLACGAVLVGPAFFYLFRVFKSGRTGAG